VDLPEFTTQNVQRFLELAEAAEVLAVGFRLFPQRLIIDFRYDEIDAPLIKVVQRVNSAEERMRELAKIRPRFKTPERFFFILWPRSVPAMKESGAWQRLVDRLESSGHASITREGELAWKVLVGLEHQETAQAIKGTGYKALWERPA
jgi:hypothetical protein